VTRLAGKAAIVTGAGTGIGRAIALALAREGAKVAVAGRRREKLQEVAQAIRRAGGEALVTVCDVSSEANSQRAVKEAEQALGHVNVLVNNAGALSVSTVESISVDEWDRLLATNLKGPFLMSRAVLPAMRRAGGGAIVNVGSVLGLVAMKDRAAYCASKGEEGRQARDARLATLPLGRFGKPDDIAELAVFLASEESSWITGTAIPVDGGLTAY